MNTTGSPPFSTDQPSWGTPTTPPAGQGHDRPTNPTNPTTPTGQPGARFFDAVRSLGIVRPDQGRWAAGVAAGIGRRYHLDPTVVRLTFAALTLFGGLGIALYALGWLFLPHPDTRIHAQQVLTGTITPGFIGAALLLLSTTHVHGPLLPLAVIALIIYKLHNRHPHPTA